MGNFLIGTAVSLGAGAISSLLTPSRREIQKVDKGKQETFTQPRSSYGDYISQVWGLARVGGILAWATFPPTERVSKKKKKSGGGKGGGGGQTTEERTYTYWGNCAFILCQPITEVKEIRLNGKLVWKDGTFAATFESQGAECRVYYGGDDQGVDPLMQSHLGNETIPYRYRSLIVFENLPLAEFSNSYPQCSAIVRNGFPKLSDIILEICLESPHLSEDDIDVSDLTAIDVTGFQIDKEASLAEKLQLLQKCYFFDLIDSGDKLKFQRQYRPNSVAYIPPSQLACYEEGQKRPKRYRETKADLTELPTQYEVRYFDKNNNLLAGVARSPQFPTAEHTDLRVIDYPGCLNEDEAKTIANKNLWLDWTRAFSQELSLSPRYWHLEPGDVIEIDIEDVRQMVQIKELDLGANYQLLAKTWNYNGDIFGFSETAPAQYSAGDTADQGVPIDLGRTNIRDVVVSDGTTTYVEGVDYTVDYTTGIVTPIVGGGIPSGTNITVTYQGIQEPKDPPLPTVSNTTLRVLDLPHLFDDDPKGVYVFADGDTNWRNASLYVSRNGGVTYNYADFIATRSVFGVCDTVLASGTTSGIDVSSTVQITVPFHAELESISETDLYLGVNRALIGNEIVDFQTATLLGTNSNGDRRYQLSNFVRGLRGTYSYVATHGSSEAFYLLSDYYVVLEGTAADIGKTLYFKAVSDGQTLAGVTPVTLTIQGNALKVWIPRIDDFSPRQGQIGSTVKIYGAGFTGATSVNFNLVNAQSFIVNSDSQITAVIANGTTAGKITVTGPGGTGTSIADFSLGSGEVAWGDIDGDINNQTDLQQSFEDIRSYALVMGLVL